MQAFLQCFIYFFVTSALYLMFVIEISTYKSATLMILDTISFDIPSY